MPRRPANSRAHRDIAAEQRQAGYAMVNAHPIFAPLLARAGVYADKEKNRCPADGWAVVTPHGSIHLNPARRGEPAEWAYIIAHCLLHLGFRHFQERHPFPEWNTACDCYIARFLADLKLGKPPADLAYAIDLPARTEERLYEYFRERGIPPSLRGFGTAGAACDMILDPAGPPPWGGKVDWTACLGQGLAAAVTSAVNVAAGVEPYLGAETRSDTPAQQARRWFISAYPLLGSLATAFEIVEDPIVCQRLSISIAAVDEVSREIFMNPAARMDAGECRFVMAHELLHVGLRHRDRRRGRDAFLWNVACDFVINGWLVEMGVGELPAFGSLYDPELKGESAEAIYDRMATDLRRYRRLCTLRGVGLGDILERDGIPYPAAACDLDEFYRNCLAQGLCYHEDQCRGLLPLGLIEEIHALSQPPLPWDVELARWFDEHFSPLEQVRTYARLSRHQSATPNIPRPRWVPAPDAEDGRTFGVILDTSGSMDRSILAKGLGAIASFSMARDVPAVRVVFCDAAAYDQGYMPPEDLAERVKVRGRGGTVLQPGVDLLERAEDFPRGGPLLIITDGFCDRLRIRRDHAFLMPEGSRLPFVPKGRVFRIR